MKLTIVLVDDNPGDRDVAGHHLRRVFPEIELRHVTKEDELQAELNRDVVDAVITDFQLGWSDGISVLNMVKARHLHCAVVMFTGSGNEEIAVEAMKAGLDDYVTKNPKNYGRLPTTLRLALQRREAQRDLEQTQDRLRETVTTLERTRANLYEKVIELERFMDVATDRELRMIELKQRNEALEAEVKELRRDLDRLRGHS